MLVLRFLMFSQIFSLSFEIKTFFSILYSIYSFKVVIVLLKAMSLTVYEWSHYFSSPSREFSVCAASVTFCHLTCLKYLGLGGSSWTNLCYNSSFLHCCSQSSLNKYLLEHTRGLSHFIWTTANSSRSLENSCNSLIKIFIPH